jgi:hypothetical protein
MIDFKYFQKLFHPSQVCIGFGFMLGLVILGSPALAEGRSRSQVISIARESDLPTARLHALAIAQTELNQGFLDPRVTVMRVGVSGEWAGQIVPLIHLQISREDWLKNPTIALRNGQVWNGQRLWVGRSNPSSNPSSMPGLTASIAPKSIQHRLTEQEDNFYSIR